MPYLIKAFFTYNPSSAAAARTYANNFNRPLGSLLTPLRLAHYVYLLVGAIRLCLNSIFQDAYHRYDLPMCLFERTFIHHMAGVAFMPTIALAFAYDFTLVVRPHRKVAPMLLDLLQCEGTEKISILCLFQQIKTIKKHFSIYS